MDLRRAPASQRVLTGSVRAIARAGPYGLAVTRSSTPPLELRGPFLEGTGGGGIPRYFLRNVTCGVFAGDNYEVSVRVEEGACVRVQTTSATKAYDARGRAAQMAVHLEVLPGALLDFDAGTTILQCGANLAQRVEIVMHPGGRLRYSEVIALGRLAAGERLAFERFASALRVSTGEGRDLYQERLHLIPAAQQLLEATLGGAGVVGTLLLLGGVGEIQQQLEDDRGVLAGWGVLPGGGGVIVRALGARPEAVSRLFARLDVAESSTAAAIALSPA